MTTIPANATAGMAHYLSKGVPPIPALGILAVCMVESGLNPLAQNNTGTETPGAINPKGSFGLAQWNGERQTGLQDFATKKGLDYNLLNTQLDRILNEMANDYPVSWAAYQNPNITLSQFITQFVSDYERPKDAGAEITKALEYANAWQSLLPQVTPTPVVTPAAPISLASVQVDLQAITKFLESPTGAAIINAIVQALIMIPK